MAADGVVRNSDSYPHSSLLGTFADHFHHPHLVLVGDGEGLATGSISVFVDKVCHYIESFTGRTGAFERHIDKTAVIHHGVSGGVRKFVASAPCGLADGHLMLVHVAHHIIGAFHLRNGTEGLVGVPFADFTHGTFGMDGSRRMMQISVKIVGVGRVGHHYGPVGGCAFGCDKVGACTCVRGACEERGHDRRRSDNLSFH